MKAIKFFFASFVFAFFCKANVSEFVGCYQGEQLGYFFRGATCTINVSSQTIPFDGDDYYFYRFSFDESGLDATVSATEIDTILTKAKTKKITFQSGTRWSMESPKTGGYLTFEKGQLVEVSLWNAFLIFPTESFTCTVLQKDTDV